MVAKYFLIAGLFSIACLLQHSNAAITPVDETYTATAGKDFTIPWTFDDEGSLDQVLWRYKSSPTATAVTILSKTGAATAVDFNNFNVKHTTNGEIKLISVTKAKNEGIYLCQVSYVLGSNIPTVTGTATLSVTNCECKCVCERLTIPCIISDVLGIIIFIVLIVLHKQGLIENIQIPRGLFLTSLALLLVSIGLGAAVRIKDCCDCSCDCCDGWVGNCATAFIVISSLAAVSEVITAIILNADKDKMPPESQEMTKTPL